MGHTYIENTAGFGLPINQNRNEPIHWWTPKNEAACRISEFGTMFAGIREITTNDIEDRGICLECLLEVMKACAILGYPENLPMSLKVRLR